jgi:hypothetical protein
MSGRKTLLHGWIVLMGFVVVTLLRASLVFADTCLADMNRDGKVDTEDLEIMQKELDRVNCFMLPCKADLNGDGRVDGNDGEILIAEFGKQDCFFGTGDILETQRDLSQMDQETALNSAEEEGVEEGIEPPEARFIDNGNGTVTDPATGLMWTKNADIYGDTLLFHQALDYIAEMNEGNYPNFGYTDWRLPSLTELRSLIDYTKLTRKGHTVPSGHPFDNLQSLYFKGRSSYISNSDYPLFVSLYCRLVGHNINSCYGYVWPVRGRK